MPVPSTAYRLTIREVTKCDGSVNLVFSRGKAKPGFEINLSMKWELGEEGHPPATGTASIPEISDTEGSDYFTRLVVECVSADAPLDRASAKRMVENAKNAFREALQSWCDAVKSM